MKELEKQIKTIEASCLKELAHARSLESLEAVRVAYLGRSGALTDLMSSLKQLSLDQKRTVGPALNELKQRLHAAYESRQKELEKKSLSSDNLFDVTAYAPNQPHGSLHIYTHIIEQLSSIFISMGYTIADGPEMETEYYNFTTLNIPKDHPARDSHDTFWLSMPDRLLRTHTSSVQAHSMEQNSAPLAIFAPGRCYRNEATDATHDFMFTQGEGLFIDKNVSMAQLLATAQTFLQQFFGKTDLKIRVRPGYFPFVEPGVEIDGSCPFCQKGCSICKHTGWIELLGAGLVHPNVLRVNGIDPEQYNGFAFGFGIERLAMIKYGITDIRLFHSAQIPFLQQFA
ncbi:MAG TPA: phenylalanine--tRNA ligase subunit alpha [Candidatus Babeliales bacterium]|nr:phenylalanine--tRNA ligase subunit alpha [Candidatus Babeliales bacterium]